MAKIHTSVIIELTLWQSWLKYCVDKTGSAKMSSALNEKALKEYMEMHP
jgi:hypothetical protein